MTQAAAGPDPTQLGQKSCHLRSENGDTDETLLQSQTLENPGKDEAVDRKGTGIENGLHLFQESC